jgi:hypothetical protein
MKTAVEAIAPAAVSVCSPHGCANSRNRRKQRCAPHLFDLRLLRKLPPILPSLKHVFCAGVLACVTAGFAALAAAPHTTQAFRNMIQTMPGQPSLCRSAIGELLLARPAA